MCFVFSWVLFQYLLFSLFLFLTERCFFCFDPRLIGTIHLTAVFYDFLFVLYKLQGKVLLEAIHKVIIMQMYWKEGDKSGISYDIYPLGAKFKRRVDSLKWFLAKTEWTSEGIVEIENAEAETLLNILCVLRIIEGFTVCVWWMCTWIDCEAGSAKISLRRRRSLR